VPGRHRNGLFGLGWGRRPVAVGGAALLIVLAAVTVGIVSANASGCSSGVTLRIAATPEIAPALTEIAAEWMSTGPQVNGQCVNVIVDAAASASVASKLTVFAGRGIDIAAVPEPTPSESSLPAVWIPDSTAWLARVGVVDSAVFVGRAQSIACSPVVLAMPEAAAKLVGWPAAPVALSALKSQLSGGSIKLGISEPRRETAGLAAAIMLSETLATTDDELPGLVAILRRIVKTSSTGELLRTFSDKMNVGPASEQAVLAFDAGNPPLKLVPVAIDPVAPVLDYPYAVRVSVSQEVTLAAGMFRTALGQPAAMARLASVGFRSPDGKVGSGFPSSTARNQDPQTVVAIREPTRIQRAIGLWTAANSPSRTLALFDVTSSMDSPMQTANGPLTRTQVMVAATRGGLSLFAADSKVGMWAFAAEHQQVLPIEELTADRRAEFDQRLASVQPTGTNQANLYATLLAAYQQMKDGYDPTRPNLIIVLTDGGDSDQSDLARIQFDQQVQKLADPTRPIRVVLIGLGADQNAAANLQAIAHTVGGGYFPLTSPEQIQSIFLKALLQVGAA
jgi:Ca-activated chloride channel family protein